jgi:hypothetical protein
VDVQRRFNGRYPSARRRLGARRARDLPGNLEHPTPGSEKPGLFELAPESLYGRDGQPFSVQARYFEERPPLTQGTEWTPASPLAFATTRTSIFWNRARRRALCDARLVWFAGRPMPGIGND